MVAYRTAERAAFEIESALFTATQTMFADQPDVLVAFGHPGMQMGNFNDIVAWMDYDVEQEPATLTSTKRTRNADISIQLVVSAFRPGGHEEELVAAEAATALLEDIEDHIRATDPTLGDRAWKVMFTNHFKRSAQDGKALAKGRTVELFATVVASVRITS